jgi:hypothetical protein
MAGNNGWYKWQAPRCCAPIKPRLACLLQFCSSLHLQGNGFCHLAATTVTRLLEQRALEFLVKHMPWSSLDIGRLQKDDLPLPRRRNAELQPLPNYRGLCLTVACAPAMAKYAAALLVVLLGLTAAWGKGTYATL